MTTTQITDIAAKLDLSAYAGDFIDDYNMPAVHADYVTALDAAAPAGVTVTASGVVFADLEAADVARGIDWDELAEGIDVAAIFERHDLTRTVTGDVESAHVGEIEDGLRERGLADVEVTRGTDTIILIAREDDARVTSIGGEVGGWTYTVYADEDRDDIITTDGVEGTGPDALARVLDAIAAVLR